MSSFLRFPVALGRLGQDDSGSSDGGMTWSTPDPGASVPSASEQIAASMGVPGAAQAASPGVDWSSILGTAAQIAFPVVGAHIYGGGLPKPIQTTLTQVFPPPAGTTVTAQPTGVYVPQPAPSILPGLSPTVKTLGLLGLGLLALKALAGGKGRRR